MAEETGRPGLHAPATSPKVQPTPHSVPVDRYRSAVEGREQSDWEADLHDRGRTTAVGPGAHAAQHESLATSVVKVWAASFTDSAMVRYGAQVSARSATLRPNLTA